MGLIRLLVLLCSYFLCSQALQCHHCKNSAPGICLDDPGLETCQSSDPVCFSKVRNDAGVLYMTRGCKNRNACNNQILQNRQGCASGVVKGQCYYHCCDEEKCNEDDRRDYTVGQDCTQWGSWSACSRSCGYGLRIRTRQCIDYSQDSVSGTKSRSKAKSMKCSSKSSKKSKSKNKCEYINQYEYDLCNTESCSVQKCYSCNTSSSVLQPSEIWNCINNDVECQNEEEYCLYSYWASDTNAAYKLPRLGKRCASKATCDLYIGDLGLSGKCAILVYELAKDKITSGTNSLSIQDVVNFDDITTLVQRLDEPCHVCCKGSLCNEGFLPAFSALYPSTGETVHVSIFMILALSTILLTIFCV